MRGQEPVVTRFAGRKAGKAAHHAKEPRRGLRVIARLAGKLDALAIGIELLVLAEGGHGLARPVGRGIGRGVAAKDAGDHAVDDFGGAGAIGPGARMAQRHMGDFMRQHGRQLARIAGQRQDAARHIDIAARQGEGIDLGTVEDGDLELRIGLVGGGQQPADDSRHHDLGRPVGINPAIGRDDARMLAAADHHVLGIGALGHHRRRRIIARLADGDIGPGQARAAAQRQQRHGQKAIAESPGDLPQTRHRSARTSICSG
jgi:hypothetical protein